MYTIIMDEDKQLVQTEVTALYKGENLVDKIRFLLPLTYNETPLSEFSVVAQYTNEHLEIIDEPMPFTGEKYRDYKYVYHLPVDTDLTKESGVVYLTLAFKKDDNVVLRSSGVFLSITNPDDEVPSVPIDPDIVKEQVVRVDVVQNLTEEEKERARNNIGAGNGGAGNGAVTSVNGKTGAVNLSASDIGALPDTYTPPVQTAEQVGADPVGTATKAVGEHNVSTASHSDIRLQLTEIANRLNAFLDTDDTTLDELSEIVAYIKSNKELIDAVTTSKVNVTDIVNNLTTNVTNKPLSAAQGVALKALIDAITVPTKLSELTGDTTHRVVTDTEKNAWNAKSDFSGSYNDLTDKPVIPTVPTKLSEFDNDKGYLTSYTETDPTVSDWAKEPNKPSYTKAEIGLGNVDNVKQYSASNPPPYPVVSVNGKTGAVSLSASDVKALPDTYTPPDQTAAQVGADAKGTAEAKVSAHNTSDAAHNDIRLLISGLTTRLNALADSTDTDLDQLSEIVAYIKSNKSLIDGITTNKVNVADIVNNLTTNVSNKPLSAAQGVALKALIDAITVPTKLSELAGDSTHRTVTDEEKTAWNAKSNFSGAYNDLTGKPTIPSKTSQLTNDSNFLTSIPSEYVTETELANKKYLTSIPSEYITETELNAKGYLTQHQDLSGYAKKSDIPTVPTKVSTFTNDAGYLKAEGISLGIASDGLIYIFVNGNPVGTGIPQGQSGDVFGYVDENNTVVLKGNLADGTYSIKYETDDDTIDIGNLVLDSTVYYSVTSNLTNCTSNNSTKQIAQGESYSATITAKSGYELKSVTATMGGNAVSVSGGVINIASVTGIIVITAVAEEIVVNYTNLADPTSSDWGTDKRLGNSDGAFRDETGTTVTNYIPIYASQTVYIKGMDITSKSCGVYNHTKAVQSVAKITAQATYLTDVSATATGGQATWKYANGGTAEKPWYVRFAGILNGTANDVIITIDEPIE